MTSSEDCFRIGTKNQLPKTCMSLTIRFDIHALHHGKPATIMYAYS